MNRHSSYLSKTYRIWHLKWLRIFLDSEVQLLLVTPPASERKMDIEVTRYEVCFQYCKTSHLGKILLLSGLFEFILYKLDMQDPQESDY